MKRMRENVATICTLRTTGIHVHYLVGVFEEAYVDYMWLQQKASARHFSRIDEAVGLQGLLSVVSYKALVTKQKQEKELVGKQRKVVERRYGAASEFRWRSRPVLAAS